VERRFMSLLVHQFLREAEPWGLGRPQEKVLLGEQQGRRIIRDFDIVIQITINCLVVFSFSESIKVFNG
jgi:hypothetical protein